MNPLNRTQHRITFKSPIPVPIPVINPWPVPQVQVQPPTPGFDPTQYASTMNQLNRPPRAARGATPEDIRRVTAGPLRDLMTSTSAAVQQPRQAYPQVPGNTFYHAQLNPPGPPPPAYPQNEVQAARVVTWGPHVRAFPPLYEQPPDYNPGPAPPRAAAPPPDPGNNNSSNHNLDNPPPRPPRGSPGRCHERVPRPTKYHKWRPGPTPDPRPPPGTPAPAAPSGHPPRSHSSTTDLPL